MRLSMLANNLNILLRTNCYLKYLWFDHSFHNCYTKRTLQYFDNHFLVEMEGVEQKKKE